MAVNTSASSRASCALSLISSWFMRVHSAQIRTFSSVGVSRTAFSNALQNSPAILCLRAESSSPWRISFFAFSSSTARAAASSRRSSGRSRT